MADDADMYVTKRNGKLEVVAFDKILQRIKKVGNEANIKINYTALTMKVIDQLYDKISTTKIDELTAEQCASMASTHPDYNVLAGRVTISNHHKNTDASFTKVMTQLYQFKDIHGNHQPLVSKELYQALTTLGHKKLNGLCDFQRDYLIDFFGFKTLERAYLMKLHKKIVERPQHMWLRVAIGIHGTNWDKIVETYEHMSNKYFTHATPTLFNAGTPSPQLSSCYLMSMEDDSIDGIFNTLKDCALISKWAGGIGLHIHNVRATGTHINGTNGTSNGIVPMLKVFNNTAKYVDQCVTPDTWIYTTHGPQKIEDVIAHETCIVNETGATEVIDNVLEHPYEGSMLQIYNMHSVEPLQVTPEHPLYVLAGSDIEAGNIQGEYRDAKDITLDDYMIYSIPTYTQDIASITDDDCFMYGMLLQVGRFSNQHSHGYLQMVTPGMQMFCEQYFASKCVPYTLVENQLKWKKTIDLPFRHTDFYNSQNEYHIASRWLHLPKTKLAQIIKGYLVSQSEEQPSYTYTCKSKRVSESMRYMFLRLGVAVKRSHQAPFCMKLPRTQVVCTLLGDDNDNDGQTTERSEYFIHDNKIFSRVTCVTTTQYQGTLYDLQMKDVHSYMVHNGVIHNGGGKRNGSFAIYLEPWHADIEMFLQMRKNHGDEELKARDLFYALWVPDLFMERVKTNGTWTLMCPHECPGLSDVYGETFTTLYTQYESENRGKKTVSARDLWFQILDAQMETGTPYLLYKDAANLKSNQKNVGTIKSSNLCVAPETFVLTDEGQYPIYSLCTQNYPIDQQATHKTVNVWNGSEFSAVEVVKTGEDQALMEVFTSDGMNLVCTPYHKFYIQQGDSVVVKEAHELQSDDVLETATSWPTVDGPDMMDRQIAIDRGVDVGMRNLRLTSESVKGTYLDVPMHYTLQSKYDWLTGFLEPFVCDIDPSVDKEIRIPSRSHVFLQDLKLMLQTCGVNVAIHKQTNGVEELALTLQQLRHMVNNGLAFYEPYIPASDPLTEEECKAMALTVKVTSTRTLDRKDDTYCFTEPMQHAGIFNGMRTSQCTEIIEYSDEHETAVCNLASIALPAFVETAENAESTKPRFNFDKLHEVTKIVTNNLNRIIDVNYYPTPKTRVSNMRHRPIGIGVQGLADVFLQMGLTFACDEAKQLNKDIFETIYHGSLERSYELAIEEGPYETFSGSPASQGILQFDMWNVDPGQNRYDWAALKQNIQTKGIRNSLLLAPMPTASTSQILGYNECMEPITSNIYTRRTIAGEFIMVNKYLMKELLSLDMWNETLKNHMVANNGSIQALEYIPQEIRDKYKTVWEIPMRDLIDMSADRGAFVCQSQSLNLWLEDPNYNTMTSMHFYSWQKGLKTGIYYLRRRPRHQAQQFTIEPEKRKATQQEDGPCEMCSA